jgi:hypothetical protein
MKTEARIYFPLPCDPIFQKHSLPAIFALSILELENSSPSQARATLLSAGSGGGTEGANGATSLRAIPLPHLSGEVHFRHRRLTLVYDTRGLGPDPLSVMYRFIDHNPSVTIDAPWTPWRP